MERTRRLWRHIEVGVNPNASYLENGNDDTYLQKSLWIREKVHTLSFSCLLRKGLVCLPDQSFHGLCW